jgi:hypothetical protein
MERGAVLGGDRGEDFQDVGGFFDYGDASGGKKFFDFFGVGHST